MGREACLLSQRTRRKARPPDTPRIAQESQEFNVYLSDQIPQRYRINQRGPLVRIYYHCTSSAEPTYSTEAISKYPILSRAKIINANSRDHLSMIRLLEPPAWYATEDLCSIL